jgi:hypothetical protein
MTGIAAISSEYLNELEKFNFTWHFVIFFFVQSIFVVIVSLILMIINTLRWIINKCKNRGKKSKKKIRPVKLCKPSQVLAQDFPIKKDENQVEEIKEAV